MSEQAQRQVVLGVVLFVAVCYCCVFVALFWCFDFVHNETRGCDLFSSCFVVLLCFFCEITTANFLLLCLRENLQVLVFSFARVLQCFWFVFACV